MKLNETQNLILEVIADHQLDDNLGSANIKKFLDCRGKSIERDTVSTNLKLLTDAGYLLRTIKKENPTTAWNYHYSLDYAGGPVAR